MKKNLFISIFLVFVLTACGSPVVTQPTESTFLPSTATFEPTNVPTANPTATLTLPPTPTITLSPTPLGGGAGRLIFTQSKEEYIKTFPDLKGVKNAFIIDVDGTDLTPITNGLEGYNYLKEVSPDGTKVLIASTTKSNNKTTNLYLINLKSLDSEPIKIAEGLPNFFGDNSPAKWIDDSQILYIGKGDAGFGIYSLKADGTNPTIIVKYNNDGEGNKPHEVLAVNKTHILWDSRSGTDKYGKYNYWLSSRDGTERKVIEYDGKPLGFDTNKDIAFSPDGTKVIWIEGATRTFHHNYLHIASITDIDNQLTLDSEPLTSYLDFKWFPDGSKILVFDIGSAIELFGNPYDSTNNLSGLYKLDVSNGNNILNYHLPKETVGSMLLFDISPDGRQVVIQTDEKNGTGGVVPKIMLLNLETQNLSEISDITILPNDGVHWIP
jgi:hypothetical protein